MKLTREQAIKVINEATDREDPYWDNVLLNQNLMQENPDDDPSIYDVMEAIGISREEFDRAIGASVA